MQTEIALGPREVGLTTVFRADKGDKPLQVQGPWHTVASSRLYKCTTSYLIGNF